MAGTLIVLPTQALNGAAPSTWANQVKANFDALNAERGARPTYTPALTAATTNPAMGTGATVYGDYAANDKNVWGNVDLVFGTGATAGTGAYFITLPVPALSATTGVILGAGYIVDVSAVALRHVVARIATTTTAQLYIDSSASPVGAAAPWVWAATDQIRFQFNYQAA